MANGLEANRVIWSGHRVLKGRRGGRQGQRDGRAR